MFENFDAVVKMAGEVSPKRTVSVAAAGDPRIMEVVKELLELELCRVILVDREETIREQAQAAGVDLEKTAIVDEPDPGQVGRRAVELVSRGDADVLVKGMMNSSDFLRAVLDPEVGLRTGRKLSVLTGYEVPRLKKLLFMTDGGMVIAPSLEDKAEILRGAVTTLHNIGIREPKVALLSANEKVSEKMPSSVDAAKLCEMARNGELPGGIYEGPIAFDVAMRPEAAEEKKISSRISGDVDLLLVPNIETGNCLGKAIGYFGGGETAGIVVGAAKPVVMSSRAASIRGKLVSIAWALLSCENQKEER